MTLFRRIFPYTQKLLAGTSPYDKKWGIMEHRLCFEHPIDYILGKN